MGGTNKWQKNGIHKVVGKFIGIPKKIQNMTMIKIVINVTDNFRRSGFVKSKELREE